MHKRNVSYPFTFGKAIFLLSNNSGSLLSHELIGVNGSKVILTFSCRFFYLFGSIKVILPWAISTII
jgi:hypothetical protein